jgi:16S rRNA processing protein RimM
VTVQIVVGRIGRAHGIRGELTVDLRTDEPETRFAAGSVLATDPAETGPLTVAASRWHSGRLLVAFEGFGDRTAAETLRGTVLVIDSAEQGPLDDPDEFYDWQLEGLQAELPDGTPVGTVAEVLHLPHGDVLAVRREGAEELLVPFIAAQVPVVDVAGGRVVVDPAPGLLDL